MTIEKLLSPKPIINEAERQQSLLTLAQGVGFTGEEIIHKILRDSGLTQLEIEVYVFLARHGVLKSREVARQMKKDKGLVLRVLKNLQAKGMAEPTLETPQRFSAIPFEKVLEEFVKARREEAALIEKTKKELLLHWKGVGKTTSEVPVDKFIVIEGSQRIRAKILKMIAETKRQFSTTSAPAGLHWADKIGLLEVVANHPRKSQIQFRFLSETPTQITTAAEPFIKRAKMSGVILRKRNSNLGGKLSPRMVIRDEDELVLFFTPTGNSEAEGPSETCLWTNCNDLVRSFTAVFEDLWINSVELEEKTVQIGKAASLLASVSYLASDKAKKKHEAMLSSAKEEIVFTTSSNG